MKTKPTPKKRAYKGGKKRGPKPKPAGAKKVDVMIVLTPAHRRKLSAMGNRSAAVARWLDSLPD